MPKRLSKKKGRQEKGVHFTCAQWDHLPYVDRVAMTHPLGSCSHFSSIYVCVVVTNLFWRSHFLDSTHYGQLSIWGLHNFVSKLDSIIILGSASIPCPHRWTIWGKKKKKKKKKGSEVNPVTMVAQMQTCDLKITLIQRRKLSSSWRRRLMLSMYTPITFHFSSASQVLQ
jgi:hypothetical protein